MSSSSFRGITCFVKGRKDWGWCVLPGKEDTFEGIEEVLKVW